VVTLQHQYVRPISDDPSETKLSDDCKSLTGLCEDDVMNAPPLDHVLDDVRIARGRLGRLAAWLLPGGPVGPPARWAATSNVEVGQTTR